MAEKISDMAVSSDSNVNVCQREIKGNGKEENIYNPSKNDAPKKKSTFKITSITKNTSEKDGNEYLIHDNDLDSQDDLDETVDSHNEETNSFLDSSSKYTDLNNQDRLLSPDEIIKDTISHEVLKDKPEEVVKEKPARFKVVKVETKEPFKRGRWICYDCLDLPEKNENKQEEIKVSSGSSSAANSIHYIHGVDDLSKNPLLAGTTGTLSSQCQTTVDDPSKNPLLAGTTGALSSQCQTTGVFDSASFNRQGEAHPISSFIQTITSPGILQNSYFDNGKASQSISNSVQSAVASQPISFCANPILLPVSLSTCATALPQDKTYSSFSLSSGIPYANDHLQSNTGQSSLISHCSSLPSTIYQHQMIVQCEGYDAAQSRYDPQSNVSFVNATSVLDITAVHHSVINAQQAKNEMPFSAHSRQLNDSDEVSSHQSTNESLVIHVGCVEELTTTLNPGLDPLEVAVGGITNTNVPADNEISSSSTVAIDNKIEQAMDLVKSHLMYAVREEIEVLKEQIKELMERLRVVEYENKVLRNEASLDTLAKLSPPLPPLSSSNPHLQQFLLSTQYTPSSSTS